MLERALFATDDTTLHDAHVRAAIDDPSTDLMAVARWLTDSEQNVRLAAIHILGGAKFRAAIGPLSAVAKARAGDERSAAIDALTHMVGPGDHERLQALLQLDAPEDQLLRLRAALTLAPDTVALTEGLLSSEADVRRAALIRVLKHAANPAHELTEGLLQTHSDAVRLELLGGLATLPETALLRSAETLLREGSDDVTALVARTLQRKLTSPAAKARAATAIGACKKRAHSELCKMALDSAALSLDPAGAAREQAAALDTITPAAAAELAQTLRALSGEAKAGVVHALCLGLQKAPGWLPTFASGLQDLEERDILALRPLVQQLMTRSLPNPERADFARLCARVVAKGAPIPHTFLAELRRGTLEDRRALVELCLATSTEESAFELLRLHQELPEADAALRAFSSTECDILAHPGAEGVRLEIIPRYLSPAGKRLRVDGRFLRDADENLFVKDEEGRPVLLRNQALGHCLCCPRARALVSGKRPRCPLTGEEYLIEDGQALRLRDHLTRACPSCPSSKPLRSVGKVSVCDDCGTRFMAGAEGLRRVQVERPKPAVKRPTMAAQPYYVQQAMRATVVFSPDNALDDWRARGFCVASAGDELAILTSRRTTLSPTALTYATTVAGERVLASPQWISEAADLALFTITVNQPGEVARLAIGSGVRPSRGMHLFAVSDGQLAQFVVDQEQKFQYSGVGVRVMHCASPLPGALIGGGVYAQNGRLSGMLIADPSGMQRGTQSAVALDSIVGALRRERVTFAGRRLS